LKPSRKFAYLGCLAHEVSWKYQAVTATLEEKRKKAKVHYWKKKQVKRLLKEVGKNVGKKNKFTVMLKTHELLVRAQYRLSVPHALPESAFPHLHSGMLGTRGQLGIKRGGGRRWFNLCSCVRSVRFLLLNSCKRCTGRLGL
jgi:hypothetical protein